MNIRTHTIYRLSVYICLIVLFNSCETEEAKQAKIERKERLRVLDEKRQARQDSLRQIEIEKESIEKEIYERYINNSLKTGATPYAYLYGPNLKCDEWGCSEIKINAPRNSDILATIKKDGRVVKHAYINSGGSYKFEMPNGTYQPFFYYGKGWNPNKIMKKTDRGVLKGGFVDEEHFGKDDPQYLSNYSLEYTLILQTSGNFREKSSSAFEAF